MIVDIINKKRLGKELSFLELEFIFNGYLEGTVKDYQMSSLLMAICIQGMSDDEIFGLTKIFIESGDQLDLSFIPGVKVDKHSTGGIGDKTTLIIAPIVASLGIPVIKMSGRGLGYTGGTIDKLESIPGFRISLSEEEVMDQVKKHDIVVTGQTANLTPMDKKVYALRDVTGTVSSIPLIASSIMSKKIAGGADKILIDIKVGNGALLATEEDAKKLSEVMKKIGEYYNKEVRTIISDMNSPLGYAVGNSLEVLEAIEVLQGKEENTNLTKVCYQLDREDALDLVRDAIASGKAYQKFLEFVQAQGGDLSKLTVSSKVATIKSPKSGVISSVSAIEVGKLSMNLGAGRKNKEDTIDYGVGVRLCKQVGDAVKKGEVLAKVYYNKKINLQDYQHIFSIK